MKAVKIILFVLGSSALIFGALHFWPNLTPAVISPISQIIPSEPQKPARPLETLGWIPYWDQRKALETLSANPQKFNFISLFWYGLTPEGKIVTYKGVKEDPEIFNFARQNNIKVLAVLANLIEEEGDTWDYRRVDLVISDSEKRRSHIDEIITKINQHGFDGVNIDYEALKASQRENFSIFIKELSSELHNQDKILGVAIHPKTSEGNPKEDNGSRAQDLSEIARYADQMYFMTYGEHSQGTEPGPIASISWVDKIISYAKKLEIPEEKIFLGIGLYGLEWQKEDGHFASTHTDTDELLYREVSEILKNNQKESSWDNGKKAPYFRYKIGEKEHIVWFENERSVSEKVEFAKKNRFGGVAFWRLGSEDPEIFPNLNK